MKKRGDKADKVKLCEKEYAHNRRFREYVDKYAEKHGLIAQDALKHNIVRSAMKYYTDV